MLTDKFPRAVLAHTPTPVERLDNLSDELGGPKIWIKRDDCTGLAFGGNKARQLEYYFGEAVQDNADTILITSAVQSNYSRTAVAAARKYGMDAVVQQEERVPDRPEEYYKSGNPYLSKLMGAHILSYPEGEDEEGADKAVFEQAEKLRAQGKTPYVIPLAGTHIPLGSLGYVDCAEEILGQIKAMDINIDAIICASGSGTTHAGLVAGLRAMASDIPVYGICVRRDKISQISRVFEKTGKVADMIGHKGIIKQDDIWLDDSVLSPGYGQLNDQVTEAIDLAAKCEGLLVDPVYTGKALAGLIELVRKGQFKKDQNIMFIHTGGAPALFGYPELVE
ncbi:MAG: D-cysteine desulfhydrase family protein [Kordiimonadaceae bacterium]|jgi:L-cysteate sulfo-lyase|nr:D-cysteine desulfhydrase family protein [Kordiimonadaceae bacterium]MBT6034904.1 D-cysteine desulfhydrase family protein [Kordiimonadaceae bacterium]MBT6330934.1 D-cysteine desulfhydrase family protein [Kordiimonadaceae bacterium]